MSLPHLSPYSSANGRMRQRVRGEAQMPGRHPFPRSWDRSPRPAHAMRTYRHKMRTAGRRVHSLVAATAWVPNVNPDSSADTAIVSPSLKTPSSSFSAKTFSISRWIKRFRGRAPYAGS